MAARSGDPVRPSLRQRTADRAVARALKVEGANQPYAKLHTQVPMRDGALLVADVYLPARPLATVLIRSPYGRGFPLDLLHARVFARRGYQVVVQSVRGRSRSTGEFQPVVNEAADGHDTVDWLRWQDWYSGRLATFGGSYLGLAQWLLLAEPPDDAQAAVVVVGPHDFSRAVWPAGGLALNDMFGWSLAMAAPEASGPLRQAAGMRRMHQQSGQVMGERPVLAACDAALRGAAPWFRDWAGHDNPTDAFWDPYRATDALKNSDVPTLLIGGWRDAFIDQTLEQYDALRSRGVDVALAVGPWTHMETATRATGEITRAALAWFDHCFADGAARPANVRALVTGVNQWRVLDDWPPATTTLELKLAAGRLVQDASDDGKTSFTFDPADPTPALGGRSMDPAGAGAKDNRRLAARADVIAFSGEPVPAAVEICGTPELRLRVSVTNAHSDVFVRLCEIEGNGRAVNLADAFARLDPETPAGEQQEIRMTLDPVWHQLRAGHRLQLLISGGAYPRFAAPPGDGAQPHTVHHAGTTLRLPILAVS